MAIEVWNAALMGRAQHGGPTSAAALFSNESIVLLEYPEEVLPGSRVHLWPNHPDQATMQDGLRSQAVQVQY